MSETELTQADGTAERSAAICMIDRAAPGSTKQFTLTMVAHNPVGLSRLLAA